MDYGYDEEGRRIKSVYWSTQCKSKQRYKVTTYIDAKGYERVATFRPGRNTQGQKTIAFAACGESYTLRDVGGVARWMNDAVDTTSGGGFRGMQ